MIRLENETQEDYKARRKENQLSINQKLKGSWFWRSKVVFYDLSKGILHDKFGGDTSLKTQGTYVRQ